MDSGVVIIEEIALSPVCGLTSLRASKTDSREYGEETSGTNLLLFKSFPFAL